MVHDTAKPTGLVRSNVPANEAKKILGAVFKSFHTAVKQCKGSGSSLEAKRAAGDIVPRVEAAVVGAFTAAGAQQTLYDIAVGECGAGHFENFGSHELAVFEGDKLVLHVNTDGGLTLADRFDLDGDGRHELLLHSGFSNQGETTTNARIARLAGGALVTVKELGTVYYGVCASMAAEKTETRTTVTIVRTADGQLSYRPKQQSTPCKNE